MGFSVVNHSSEAPQPSQPSQMKTSVVSSEQKLIIVAGADGKERKFKVSQLSGYDHYALTEPEVKIEEVEFAEEGLEFEQADFTCEELSHLRASSVRVCTHVDVSSIKLSAAPIDASVARWVLQAQSTVRQSMQSTKTQKTVSVRPTEKLSAIEEDVEKAAPRLRWYARLFGNCACAAPAASPTDVRETTFDSDVISTLEAASVKLTAAETVKLTSVAAPSVIKTSTFEAASVKLSAMPKTTVSKLIIVTTEDGEERKFTVQQGEDEEVQIEAVEFAEEELEFQQVDLPTEELSELRASSIRVCTQADASSVRLSSVSLDPSVARWVEQAQSTVRRTTKKTTRMSQKTVRATQDKLSAIEEEEASKLSAIDEEIEQPAPRLRWFTRLFGNCACAAPAGTPMRDFDSMASSSVAPSVKGSAISMRPETEVLRTDPSIMVRPETEVLRATSVTQGAMQAASLKMSTISAAKMSVAAQSINETGRGETSTISAAKVSVAAQSINETASIRQTTALSKMSTTTE